jgi:hypothetical protein
MVMADAPKTAVSREEPGKLASRAPKRSAAELSRVEARLNQPVVMGGNAARNSKAPLAPRASSPDLSELATNPTNQHHHQNRPPAPSSSGVIDTIEPESFADDEADIRRTVRKTSSQNSYPPPRPDGGDSPTNGSSSAASARGDFQKALSQLPGQSRLNPVPSSPPSAPAGSNRAPETRRMIASEMPPPVAVTSAGAPRSKAPSIPSVRDLVQNVRPVMASQPPPPGHASSLNAVTEVLGTAVPNNLPPTKSITAPFGGMMMSPSPSSSGPNPNNALGLKPGTGSPLAPIRTPNPMAIVGGSSLRINSPAKSMQPMQPMRPTGPPPPDVFQPSPLSPPSAGGSSSPLAFGGNTSKSMPPQHPPAPSSRPSTKPVAGGPPVQYERAFRQWSSPAIEEAPPPNGPVTFQVYTAQDVATGRRPLRSMPAIDVQPTKKQSPLVKVGLGVLGLIVVALTAAAVIAVSTEDPKKPAVTTSAAPPPPPPPLADPAPPPSTITIGDGPDDPGGSAASATPPATPPAATTGGGGGGGVKPGIIKKAQPSQPRDPSSASPPAPSGLKNIAPPPNPYGK